MNHHPYPRVFKWTDDNIAELRQLFGDGDLSCGQIAQALGCPSRNAVIGKLHRLGLGRTTRSQTPTTVTRVTRRTRAEVMVDNGVIERVKAKVKRRASGKGDQVPAGTKHLMIEGDGVNDLPPEILSSNAVTFFHLTDQHCRWPIGEPGAPDFCFCGAQPVEGLPYCSGHARIAYRPGREARAP